MLKTLMFVVNCSLFVSREPVEV